MSDPVRPSRNERYIQIFRTPLCFFSEVESRMYDELVHMLRFGTKTSNAIATNFEGAEVDLEERIVTSADDGKIVRHCVYRICSLVTGAAGRGWVGERGVAGRADIRVLANEAGE